MSSSATASSILRDGMHGQGCEDPIVEHRNSIQDRGGWPVEFGDGDGGGGHSF